MTTLSWLLLTYKVPPEPAKKRIAIRRKLKGLGPSICKMASAGCRAEMDGESVLLKTVALDRGQEEKVLARFTARQPTTRSHRR